MRYYLFLLILLSQEALAQRPIIDEFFLFETADPVKIYAALQDRAGYMWLGTSIGLYRFNGQGDLTHISDGLRQPVTSLAVFGNNVYAGYANGAIGCVATDSMILLRIQNSQPHHAIRDLYVTGLAIWAATEDGLYAVINGHGHLLDKGSGLPDNVIHTIAASPDNGLLIGTDAGLCKLNLHQGKLAVTPYSVGNGLPGPPVKIVRTVPRSNEAWLGTDSGIIKARFNGNAVTALPYKQVWGWGQVKDILVMSATHAWVGTDGYLLDVHAGDSIIITAHHYPNRSFNTLVYTNSGIIWAGTDLGMSVLSAEIAAELRITSSYNMNELTATACDKGNNLWFTQGSKLYRMPLIGEALPEHICTVPGDVSCLYAGDSDELWVGTAANGLWHLKNKHLVPAFTPEAIKADTIFSICISGRHLWVSGSQGVDEFAADGGRLQLFKHHEATDIGTDRVSYLYNDRRNRMWMATDDAGVCMYDNGYHRFDSAAGIGSNMVSTITEDSYGNIWVGTLNHGGLSRFDGKSWQHFVHENGLQNMNISTLMANATGQVVIINDAGVDEWFPGSRQFRRYNISTNPSVDSTSYVPNIAVRDTDGNVYMPGSTGLLVFKNIEEPVELKPNIAITKVSVFLKPVPFGKSGFAYRENNISFTVDGINFSNYERLHYRYMLRGYNDDWVNLSERTLTFPRLNPGKYTFRVQASLDNDFEEAVEDNYTFTVFSPLWMRPWFIALVLISLGTLLFLYIRRREHNLKNLARLKQERIQYEFELFRSQVNPHFLFNSLNILIDLIEANPANAVDYTVQLSALYRNILTSQNKDTFLLAEECRLLDAYMHIQRNRFGDALQLDIEIPQPVMDMYKVVPLALQLLVENAIKHNMVSLSSPLVVRIYISPENEIIIRNRIQPKISRETGTGIGLQNIVKRYSLLTPKAVWYGIVDTDFIVKLPLL